MATSTLLDRTELSVAPGSDASVSLRVRNTGAVVDAITIQPLGPAAAWMVVEPAQVSLLPGDEATVRVTFRPPRVSTSVAGVSPWAVRALSSEDPEGSVVDEGAVTVEPFDDRTLELLPKTSRARRRGRHQLALDNRGNAPVIGRFTGTSPDDAVVVSFSPDGLQAPPGTAQFAKVRVRPRDTFWKGAPKTHAFQVVFEEDGKDPLAVDGAVVQESLLPPWFWKAVVAALALLLVLFILWQTLFKSTIESTATAAVQDDVEEAQAAAVEAEEAAEVAQVAAGIDPATGEPVADGAGAAGAEDAGAGSEAGGGGDAGAGNGGGGAATGDAGGGATTGSAEGGAGGLQTELGVATDFRLVAVDAPGGDAARAELPVEVDEVLSLTDVVLQNPNGDAGRLAILRGAEVLWEGALENFRDLDYHYVSPYGFTSGQTVVLQLTCTTPGNGSECSAAASFAGFTRTTS